MDDVPGSMGTSAGFALRLGQTIFSSASLLFMSFGVQFYTYTSFWYYLIFHIIPLSFHYSSLKGLGLCLYTDYFIIRIRIIEGLFFTRKKEMIICGFLSRNHSFEKQFFFLNGVLKSILGHAFSRRFVNAKSILKTQS